MVEKVAKRSQIIISDVDKSVLTDNDFSFLLYYVVGEIGDD